MGAIKRTFCTRPSEAADNAAKLRPAAMTTAAVITMSPRGVSCPSDGQLSAFLRYTEDFRRFVKFVCTHRKHTATAAADLYDPPRYFLPILVVLRFYPFSYRATYSKYLSSSRVVVASQVSRCWTSGQHWKLILNYDTIHGVRYNTIIAHNQDLIAPYWYIGC
jgi:hypothetical protein